ncbi:MAG TPA: helix-turn-helix transcriptional regulator [Longimicrobiales bacterium]
MLSEDRRKEIASFLRSRRARLQPEQVGLPRGSRRRTPGLRRAEVAALAGVSTEWYTWLEQARDVRASEAALQRIAAALRLEPGETHHLLTLAGYYREGMRNGGPSPASISPRLQRLLDELEPCPAWGFGERWDILGWNRAATIIWGDLAAMEGIERNAIYQVFVNPRLRRMLVDWEAHARDLVAKLRLVHARNVDDAWFNELIRVLRENSAEFAAFWGAHDVQLPRDGVKVYDHPQAGRLTFDYTNLDVADERFTALHLIVYVPAPGTGTREKLERLVGQRAAAGAPATRPLPRGAPSGARTHSASGRPSTPHGG